MLKEVKFSSRYCDVVLRVLVLGMGMLFMMNINVRSWRNFMILNIIIWMFV